MIEEPHTTAPETGRLSGISAFQYLLLTGCVGALTLMAARVLLSALPTAYASTEYRQATAEAQDTLDVLRKAMLSGEELPEKSDTVVDVTLIQSPFRVLRVESRVEDTPVATVVAAGSFRPAPHTQPDSPDELPRLSAETVADLLADPRLQVRRIRQDCQLTDEVLSGLIVVSPGVRLTLRNIALAGAVVSEAALSQEPLTSFDAERAPTVLVEGFLRTAPMPRLPGVSLVLPDGIVRTTDATANLSLHGAVISHDLSLQGHGSLFGQVVTLSSADMAPTIERVGGGRVPQAWPDSLDMRGSLRTDFITFLPADAKWADVQPMIGYSFP